MKKLIYAMASLINVRCIKDIATEYDQNSDIAKLTTFSFTHTEVKEQVRDLFATIFLMHMLSKTSSLENNGYIEYSANPAIIPKDVSFTPILSKNLNEIVSSLPELPYNCYYDFPYDTYIKVFKSQNSLVYIASTNILKCCSEFSR